MREHERRALRALDDARDRERFAAARDAEQHLIFSAVIQALDELLDGGGLITLRLIF